jgi:LytS/YehU family sensor histidine kinase
LGIIPEQKIAFQNLSPGSYTLTVEPDTDDGSKYKKTLLFTINPAFWQTNWFYMSFIFGGIISIILLTWFILRYYKNREIKRTEAERIIAEYRLIALKAQINPHFMSNCISAIQHLILNGKVDDANEYLAKFSFLVRQVLNLSNKPLVILREELEIIDLYVKLEKLRFDKINVEFHVDPSIDIDSVCIPPLLAQPIIENAIWHGLLPLGIKKTAVLLVIIKKENNILKIIIEDNGVGRNPQGNSIGNSRESKGIAITKQRIENLKYLNELDAATLSYQDLTDEDGNPIGTRVIISLPGSLHL